MKKIGKLKIKPSTEQSLGSHVSIGFECLDREMFDPERCYDILGQSGVKYARVQTGWVKCETEKGVYNFDWLDDIVNNLLKRGVQPWFNVGFGNPLYMSNISTPSAVGCCPMCYDDGVLEAWKNFAAALAKHYADRVTYYEIWNEPDLPNFWFPGKVDPAEYAELVNLTGEVIVGNAENAKIGACMSEALPAQYEHSKEYFSIFARKVKHLDFFSYHRYATRADVDLEQNVRFVRKIFAMNGLENLELWGGECGYPSWMPVEHSIHPVGNSSDHQQAVNLLRYYVTDAAVGCRMTSFYTIADYLQKTYHTALGDFKDFPLFGILDGITYASKEGYRALANISNLFGNDFKVSDRFMALYTRYTRPYVNMAVQPFYASFERNGKPFYVYYYPTYIEDECGLFEKPLCVRLQNMDADDFMTDPVAVDSFTGDVYEPERREDFMDLTLLHGMPVAEYPIFIMERTELEIE